FPARWPPPPPPAGEASRLAPLRSSARLSSIPLLYQPARIRPPGARERPPKRAFSVISRRRPTLPGGSPPSTIGAGGLNCRVRYGNGCFPAAMATGNLLNFQRAPRALHSEPEQPEDQPLGRLVPVG